MTKETYFGQPLRDPDCTYCEECRCYDIEDKVGESILKIRDGINYIMYDINTTRCRDLHKKGIETLINNL